MLRLPALWSRAARLHRQSLRHDRSAARPRDPCLARDVCAGAGAKDRVGKDHRMEQGLNLAHPPRRDIQ